MKLQKKYLQTGLILKLMVLLIFGFSTANANGSAPKEASKGALPIPGTSQTREYLTLNEHGTVLENDGTQLVWDKNGKLTLFFYNTLVLWSTNTSGKGKILAFQLADGQLVIKDGNGKVIWSNNSSGGEKLSLQYNRNLLMQNSSNKTIWQTNTGISNLQEGDEFQVNKDQASQNTQQGEMAQDFIVPFDINKKYLYLEAEGGDGGKKEVKELGGKVRFTVNGGAGATVKARIEIGTKDDQIPPGSIIRFFVARKGKTRVGQTTSGAGGGGSTTVLLKKPSELEWNLLMVAGGGGGAYSDCCTIKYAGHGAVITEEGGDSDGKGGKNGQSGKVYGTGNGGKEGEGIFSEITGWGKMINGKWVSGDEDPTILPIGSSFVLSTYNNTQNYAGSGLPTGGDGGTGGGGGGGYSGGGAGRWYKGGGGGGSYLTSSFAITDAQMISNPSTSDTQDGFIRYKLTDSPGSIGQAIKLAAYTRKCIAVESEELHDGNNMYIWDCKTDAKTQSWKFDGNEIKLTDDNKKCINLDGGSTKNGANIRIKNCNNTNAQKWIYDGLTRNIRSHVNTEKCIDLVNAQTTNGNNIQLWDCKTIDAQRWTIQEATTISNPTAIKYIMPAQNEDIAFQSSFGAQWGSNVVLGTKNNSNQNKEQWKFDGTQIKYNASQDLCLSVTQFDNGSNIELRNCANTPFQQWIYNGMTQQIHSAQALGKCIEIQAIGNNFANGQNLYLMDC
ncbi:MAG: ricin-type beta-trefoil lectin domain protein, partial [Bacteroidota bacterium]